MRDALNMQKLKPGGHIVFEKRIGIPLLMSFRQRLFQVTNFVIRRNLSVQFLCFQKYCE